MTNPRRTKPVRLLPTWRGVLPYRLCDEVSYCRVDDYLVFLDIRHDRYFRLSSSLEHAFLAHADGMGASGVDTNRLMDNEILTGLPPGGDRTTNVSIADPLSSAIEQSIAIKELRPSQILEAAIITLSTRWRLRTKELREVLGSMRDYRDRYATRIASTKGASTRQDLAETSAIFQRARRYVPIDTSCLLDSVAMVRFLARKGLYSRLILGVACDPFSAHCWVQAGDFVLNDTVGNAKLHTPIRVI